MLGMFVPLEFLRICVSYWQYMTLALLACIDLQLLCPHGLLLLQCIAHPMSYRMKSLAE
jgi:hypothetical protein